jgi:hypothetical protein
MKKFFLFPFSPEVRTAESAGSLQPTRMILLTAFLLLLSIFQANASGNGLIRNNDSGDPEIVFYVSTSGNDNWSGKLSEANADQSDGPFATLERARDAARHLRQTKKVNEPVFIRLRAGIYYLDQTFVLKPDDSGSEVSPTVYESFRGEKAIISGGKIIRNWKPAKGGLWKVKIPEVQAGKWYFRQLFVDGNRRERPRFPKEGLFKVANLPKLETNSWMAQSTPETGDLPKRAFQFAEGNIQAKWHNISDVEVVICQFWTETRLKVQKVDDKDNLVLFTGDAFRPITWSFGYFTENVFEEINNQPGTWYLDKARGELYYHPLPGEDMTRTEVVAPQSGLQQLVRMEGDIGRADFIHYTTLRNLTFSHTPWELPAEGHSCAQAEIALQAAILADGCYDCSITGCEFTHTGAWAIELRKGCRNTAIVGNRFSDIGSGAVKIGEPVVCKLDIEETMGTVVSDNYLDNTGMGTKGAAGIWIGQSSHNLVSHNDISGSLMWAVSAGWTWSYFPLQRSRDNIIEYNYIHELGTGILGTHGAIYTLGTSPGTSVRNNYIRNVYANEYWGAGEGIILDNGCFGITVENNIVYNADAGGYGSNFNCAGNFIHNNIFLYGSKYQLTVYGDPPVGEEQPKGEIFSRNIVVWNKGPLLNEGDWPNFNTLWNDNVYYNETGDPVTFLTKKKYTLEQWQAKGLDKNSVVADPLLVDPKNGDFSLKPESPALKLGFKPIDISTVGPRKL